MVKLSSIFRMTMAASVWGCASLASAAWVGVSLYSPGAGTDHIHVVVSDDHAPQDGAVLNVWQGRAEPLLFSWDLYQASNFLVFHSERSKAELVSYWNEHFEKIKSYRNILTSNCADASEQVLTYALGNPLVKTNHIARVIFFISVPNFLSPIRLPESVFKQTEATLKAHNRRYRNRDDYRKFMTTWRLGEQNPASYSAFLEESVKYLNAPI